jgi:hypothetical protein
MGWDMSAHFDELMELLRQVATQAHQSKHLPRFLAHRAGARSLDYGFLRLCSLAATR